MSAAWRELTDEERAPWNQMAACDKARFNYEMANYKGPLKVLKGTRQKRDPKAPKRPTPAFLSYSQAKRKEIQTLHPTLRTTEIASLLSKMWKNEHPTVREHYVHQAGLLQAKYKHDVAVHKQELAHEKKTKEKASMLAAMEEVMTDVTALSDVDFLEFDLPLDSEEDAGTVENEPEPAEPEILEVEDDNGECADVDEDKDNEDEDDNGMGKDNEVDVEPPRNQDPESEANETAAADTTSPPSQRVEVVVEEEGDAFGCDDWEPLPFESNTGQKDSVTIEGKVTPTNADDASPRITYDSPPQLPKQQENNFWKGPLPTSFLTGVPLLYGANMAAMVTPEQSPRDVMMLQQQQLERNRAALPFSLPTRAEESRIEGSDKTSANNQNYIDSGASVLSISTPSPSSLPAHMLMNPWILPNVTPPPQLDCMAPMPMYAPPRGFMASQSMPQPPAPAFGRRHSMPQAPPAPLPLAFGRCHSMALAPLAPPATMHQSIPAPAASPAASRRRQSMPPALPAPRPSLGRSKSMPPAPPALQAPPAVLGRSKSMAPVPPPPMSPVPSTLPAPHGLTQCKTSVPLASPAPRAAPESRAPSTTDDNNNNGTEDFPLSEDVEDTDFIGNAPELWTATWSSEVVRDDFRCI